MLLRIALLFAASSALSCSVMATPASSGEPASAPGSVSLSLAAGLPSFGEQQALLGTDTDDWFGQSVAIDGSTLIVGAAYEGDDQGGRAYVFERTGNSWNEQQALFGSAVGFNDLFGASVSLSGNTVLTGARQGNDFDGEAYVFVRSGTTWTEQQRLTAADGVGESGRFGWWTALEGDTAVVCSDSRVYVFVRSGTTWSEQQKLVASDGAKLFTAELSGNTVLATSPSADSGRGAAYVFVRSGNSWTQQKKLVASDGVAGDQFGSDGAIAGDTVIVSTWKGYDTSGAAYVFVRNGTTWSEQQKLTSDESATDEFGDAVT